MNLPFLLSAGGLLIKKDKKRKTQISHAEKDGAVTDTLLLIQCPNV